VTAALAAVAGSVTLMACYGVAAYPPDGCVDEDGDGYLPACYSPDRTCDVGDVNCDCNDLDPSVNPGAYDPPDGYDRDCDGKDGQRPGWRPPADASVPDGWVQDDAPPAPDATPTPDAM
jgi:hypothetical protein